MARAADPAFIGRYAVAGVLGAGGFGTVYLGTDPADDSQVAVKVLDRHGQSELVEQVRAEAAALRLVNSPHCVRVRDLIDDGVFALVTDLVRGSTLRAVLDRAGRLSGPQSLEVLRGALTGLVAVHRAGLLHGDIKPQNILIDEHGVSTLIDFGLAAPTSRRATSLVGSPAYLSPEQIAGGDLDARSDLYACGVVLFELLTGARPYDASAFEGVLYRHLTDPVPDPRAVDSAVPARFAALCMRALAKDPATRPPSAAAFLQELEDAAAAEYGRAWRSGALLGAAVASAGATYLGLSGGRVHAGHAGTGAARTAAKVRWLATPAGLSASAAVVAVVVTTVVLTSSGGNSPSGSRRQSSTALPPSSTATAQTTSLRVTPCPLSAGQAAGITVPAPRVPSTRQAAADVVVPAGMTQFGTGLPGDRVYYLLAPGRTACRTNYASADGGFALSAGMGVKPQVWILFNPGGAGPNADLACGYIPAALTADIAFRGGDFCTRPPRIDAITQVVTGSATDVAAVVVLPPGVSDPQLPTSGIPDESTIAIFVARVAGSGASAQEADCTLPAAQHAQCVAALQDMVAQSLLADDASARSATMTAIAQSH